jgi:pSer/pThr/pTyr-binding forkhead associated (FHA) protein
MTSGAHQSSPAELKSLLEAERHGAPFLVYRDGDGGQVIFALEGAGPRLTVGRRTDNELALPWDEEVSRVHAQLEAIGHEWAIADDGISRNGSYVNGERVTGRRRLRDGDRMCFGDTVVFYRAPGEGGSVATAAVLRGRDAQQLTETQRKIVIALCRPLSDSAYATPATNKEIADEVHLSVDAVKAHLRVLFARFGLDGLPQNSKRARLAAIALVEGVVRRQDF